MNRVIFRKVFLNTTLILLIVLGLITLILGLINAWKYFFGADIPGYSLTFNFVLVMIALITLVVTILLAKNRSYLVSASLILGIIFIFQVLSLAAYSGF